MKGQGTNGQVEGVGNDMCKGGEGGVRCGLRRRIDSEGGEVVDVRLRMVVDMVAGG